MLQGKPISLKQKTVSGKEIELPGSARYGSQLEKTDSDTYLVTSESIGGRGYLCEIDSNNNTISHWTSNAEKSWSTATAALKLDDGYIVALESAYSQKHEKAGTRGVVFIRLKFNNFLNNKNRNAFIKFHK